jgi:hypothetical protein
MCSADFHEKEEGRLAVIGTTLYYRSAARQHQLILLSTENLTELKTVSLPESLGIAAHSPLLVAGNRLLVITRY